MQSAGAVPPVQHEPLLFNTHYRRAEEQLAFHEKYHDRMARLVGSRCGSTNNNAAADYEDIGQGHENGGGMGYNNPAPDYWADYAKKLERMGVSRTDNVSPHMTGASAPTPPPQQCYFNSPRALCDPSRRGETRSNKEHPGRVSEEAVLQRLESLTRDKSEPDTTDVIDLLREVEDGLMREETQKHGEANFSESHKSRVGLLSRQLNTLRTYDPGRPMGVPPAPAMNANFTSHLHHASSQEEQHLPPPPPATTPTAAPSFQHATNSASAIRPPSVGADWSRMSSYQQMEWYKAYYAWMLYYAQYYGAILASQQVQKRKQWRDPPQGKENRNEPKQRVRGRSHTNLQELNREYRRLAAEVDRLTEGPKPLKKTMMKMSTRSTPQAERSGQVQRRSPSPYDAEDDTLYRSAHSHTSLRGVPQPLSKSRIPLRSRTPVHREDCNGEDRSKYGVSKMNLYEQNNDTTEERAELPWLPPERGNTEDGHQGSKRDVGGRGVSWLYKYEESDTEATSNADFDEVCGSNHSDKGIDYVRRNNMESNYYSHEEEESVLPRSRGYDVLGKQQQEQQRQAKQLSVYEQKRRDMEQSKPRWCF